METENPNEENWIDTLLSLLPDKSEKIKGLNLPRIEKE